MKNRRLAVIVSNSIKELETLTININPVYLSIFTHIIVPSFLFWVLSIKIFIIRGVINIDYLALGIFALFFRRWIFVSLWLVIFFLDVLSSVAPAFFFNAFQLLLSVKFIFNLDLSKYPFLIAGLSALLLFFLVCGSFVAVTYRQMNKKAIGWLTLCLLLIVSFDVMNGRNTIFIQNHIDLFVNRNIASSGIYKLYFEIKNIFAYSPGENKHWVESAMSHALGPIDDNIANRVAGHHFVLVIVESWGHAQDEVTARALISPFLSLSQRYTIHTGTVPFTGSTTTAELRELGGIYDDYRQISKRSDLQWIPDKLHAKGFSATGIHGFSGNMFDRFSWWPLLGFTKIFFPQDLMNVGLPQRSGVFHGIDDESIAGYIETLLRGEKGRAFVYWLTLNTHLPLERDAGENSRFNCEGTSLIRNSEACRLAKMHFTLFESIANKIAMSKDLPPIHLLIVGDHMAHFYDPKTRLLYDSKRVPYIELRPINFIGHKTK